MKDSQSLPKKQKKFIKKTTKKVVSLPKKEFQIKNYELWFEKIVRIFYPLRIANFEKNLLLFFIPLTLFLVFLLLNAINEYYAREISYNQLIPFPIETTFSPYPFITIMPLVQLSAKAAIVMDASSKVVLFSKNPELRFSMASTTKIMTALTALSYYKDNSILIIKSSYVEGTTLRFLQGSQFYFKDLLYAMLLPSANDAAVAIADNYPGGSTAFVAKMNENALKMHLLNTHFVDPDGLEDDGDYTTVSDMARLAILAIQNQEFAEVVGTKQKVITSVDSRFQYPLYNLNKLLGINGVTGIKTGTTEGAGEVLVTSAVVNGHTFIIVVMSSEDRFGDTSTLLNFVGNNVEFILPNETTIIQ